MSKEFEKYIDALSKLRFGRMFHDDFSLTWEKTDDEIKAVWTATDILRLEQRPTLVNLQCDIDHPTHFMLFTSSAG